MIRWKVLIAALVLWTLLSFGVALLVSSGNVCSILRTVPPVGSLATLKPLTKAEMNAQLAACGEPRPLQLILVGAGYVIILGSGALMTLGKRQARKDT